MSVKGYQVHEDLLIRALNKMPDVFSGKEFGSQARSEGVPYNFFVNNKQKPFLLNYCKSKGRSYIKNTAVKNEDTSYKEDTADVELCIAFLKGRGYKVYKQVDEYVEV